MVAQRALALAPALAEKPTRSSGVMAAHLTDRALPAAADHAAVCALRSSAVLEDHWSVALRLISADRSSGVSAPQYAVCVAVPMREEFSVW